MKAKEIKIGIFRGPTVYFMPMVSVLPGPLAMPSVTAIIPDTGDGDCCKYI